MEHRPGIWQMLAQLAGGGSMYPLYYFLHLVFNPPIAFKEKFARWVNLNDAIFYTPLMLVFHTIPFMGMYLASTNQDRHWWTWAWQLYTVRVSICYYILKFLRGVTGWPDMQNTTRSVASYHKTLRLVLGPMIALSLGVWIYTVISTPYSFSTLFWPAPLSAEESDSFVGLIRRMLQWDQWFVMGTSLLWVVYFMWDMWNAGIVSRGQMIWFLALVGLVPLVGPGPTFGVMWLVREIYLVGGKEKSAKLR